MHLPDMGFSFICRRTYANDEGKNPLVLRVVFRKERRDAFTGLYCFRSNWDANSRAVLKTGKSFRMVNQNLQIILQRANRAFGQLKFSGVPFTIDEFISKMKGIEEGPELLIDFLQAGYNVKNYPLSKIDAKFLENYYFMRTDKQI
jgi:hypothetical protein